MTSHPPDDRPTDTQFTAAAETAEPVGQRWSWVDQVEAETEVDLDRHRVTAVLVAMDAEDWLPRTLTALAAASPRPWRVLAVDNASTDATGRLLDQARADKVVDSVLTTVTPVGFGTAVATALDGFAPVAEPDPRADAAPDPTDWLWLLHDDVEVRPDTLDRMLRQVARDPGIAVAGPKLLRPRSPSREESAPAQLSEIGQTLAASGRRELGLEPGEVDQGQHDEPREVLGVSTCAMLVRRDVWDALGGLSAAVPVFRDGLELGWRARLAGYRVMTSPSASAVHRQVGRAGLRVAGPAAAHPVRLDRALGLHLVQGHRTGLGRVWTWLRLTLGCVLRALGYLLGKAPGRAVDELAALGQFLRHPGRTRTIRAATAAVPRADGAKAAVGRLRPPWWSGLALAADRAGRALAERNADRAADRDPSLSLDELTGDDFAGGQATAPPWRSATAVTVVAGVVLALVAAHGLYRTGWLTSTALLPAGTWTATWQAWLSPVPGSDPRTAPWLGWVAAGATLLAGRPEWLVTLLLCGLPPLAFLASQPLLSRLVADRRVRWWAGVTWAVLPPLLGGTTQGRLSLAVLAIGLPLTASAAYRLATTRGLRSAWAVGLGLAVLTAFEPTVLVPALVAGAGGAALSRNLRLLGRFAVAVAVPLVVWAPWWVTLARAGELSRLLFGPDPATVPAGTLGVPATWALLVARPGGPGLPPVWLSVLVLAAVWLTALAALALDPRRRAVQVGWLTGLVAVAAAIVVSRLVAPVGPLAIESRPWAGALLLVGFGGLVLAAAAGLGRVFELVVARSFGVLQPLSVLAAVVVSAVSLVGAAWFGVAGAGAPLHRDELTALPPYIRDAQHDDGVRTLAIAVTGDTATWSLLADDQQRLGAAERGFGLGGSAALRDQLGDLTRRLVGGVADEDIAPALTGFGVQYVWVAGAPADQQIKIGNTPGLSAASGTATARVWRLTASTGRALVTPSTPVAPAAPAGPPLATAGVPVADPRREGDHAGTGTVPPGSGERALVLAEPADPRWRASLDGRPLQPVSDPAGRARFRLPAQGGALHWQLTGGTAQWLVPLGQGLVLLVLLVLALPALRPESRHPTTAARRAAGVTPRPRSGGRR